MAADEVVSTRGLMVSDAYIGADKSSLVDMVVHSLDCMKMSFIVAQKHSWDATQNNSEHHHNCRYVEEAIRQLG